MKYFDTFTGIGGFTLGINNAYEEFCNANRSKDGGSQKNTEGDKGEGLLSTQGEGISPTEGSASKCNNNFFNERPLCVGYSEIDKYASSIYSYHYPEHKNYGDITKINAEQLPDFDLLVGGFPCQSFSVAGKRRGFEDTRGTMFFELARILRAKQPRLCIFENVKGLLSHDNGDTFKTIISALDELGYDLQWQVLNSKNFGVGQNRERVFIIGHLRGTTRPEVFPFTANSSKTLRQIVAGSQANRIYEPEGLSATLASQPGGMGARTGLYVSRVNRKAGAYDVRNTELAGTLTATMNKGLDASGRTGVINMGQNDDAIFEGAQARRLTPLECERLQAFPDGWTKYMADGTLVSDTQRYKVLGNAVTVNVVTHLINSLAKQNA